MAFTPTALQDARTAIQTNKKFELRPILSKVTEAALKYRDQSVVNLAGVRKASTQTTTVLYNANTNYTVNSGGKSCTPTGTEGATSSVDLTWVTRDVKIFVDHKVHAGNELSMQEALNTALYNGEKSLWFYTGGVDAYIVAWLETNKSSVNSGTIGSFDTYADDTMVIPNASINRFYGIVQTEMGENNFNPNYQDIYNTAWNYHRDYWVNQGAGNSANTEFQFDGFEFNPSNNVTASGYYGNIHYIVPTGGISLIDWSENDATGMSGKVVGDKKWGSMNSLFYPNIKLDYLQYEQCVDSSARGGAVQDIQTVWEITLNFAMAKQPTPTGSPIFKYGVLSA